MSNQSIDRTTLPIRRPPVQGVENDTLDASQPDWEHVAPIRAPNVIIAYDSDGAATVDKARRRTRIRVRRTFALST